MRALAKDSAWVRQHENIFVIGPCGVGKSFLASALAQKACRNGYSALYLRAAALSRELALARADGSLRHFLARMARIDVLVIDDWAMAPLQEAERREVWEIFDVLLHFRLIPGKQMHLDTELNRGGPVMSNESFSHSIYDEQVHIAECELSAFVHSVTEFYGPEQARLSAKDWLDESDLMDSPPRSERRNWAVGDDCGLGSARGSGESSTA